MFKKYCPLIGHDCYELLMYFKSDVIEDLEVQYCDINPPGTEVFFFVLRFCGNTNDIKPAVRGLNCFSDWQWFREYKITKLVPNSSQRAVGMTRVYTNMRTSNHLKILFWTFPFRIDKASTQQLPYKELCLITAQGDNNIWYFWTFVKVLFHTSPRVERSYSLYQ